MYARCVRRALYALRRVFMEVLWESDGEIWWHAAGSSGDFPGRLHADAELGRSLHCHSKGVCVLGASCRASAICQRG